MGALMKMPYRRDEIKAILSVSQLLTKRYRQTIETKKRRLLNSLTATKFSPKK
jgi:hypothetical protein